MATKTTTTEKTEPVVVKAYARHVHVSPRKARLVADLIRGHKVSQAIVQLQNLHKAAAKPVFKLLLSAIANAEHNFKLVKENLKISKITVDGGSPMKRWKVRAYGRASGIRRPTAHIFIELAETGKSTGKSAGFFPVITKRLTRKTKSSRGATGDEHEHEEPKSDAPKTTEGKGEKAKPKKGFLGIKKNIFNRKGGEK